MSCILLPFATVGFIQELITALCVVGDLGASDPATQRELVGPLTTAAPRTDHKLCAPKMQHCSCCCAAGLLVVVNGERAAETPATLLCIRNPSLDDQGA
jgi:hypothetical protein